MATGIRKCAHRIRWNSILWSLILCLHISFWSDFCPSFSLSLWLRLALVRIRSRYVSVRYLIQGECLIFVRRFVGSISCYLLLCHCSHRNSLGILLFESPFFILVMPTHVKAHPLHIDSCFNRDFPLFDAILSLNNTLFHSLSPNSLLYKTIISIIFHYSHSVFFSFASFSFLFVDQIVMGIRSHREKRANS